MVQPVFVGYVWLWEGNSHVTFDGSTLPFGDVLVDLERRDFMKTRTVLMDFGKEIFGEFQCQDEGDHVWPSEAKDDQQIASSDERTGAMHPKLQDAESAAPPPPKT